METLIEKTLRVGVCEGRHQMPCTQFIFGTSVDPTDMVGLQATADAAVAKFAQDGVQRLELFVTGLTAATLAVVSAAVKSGMAVTAMHFNRETGCFDPQELATFPATVNVTVDCWDADIVASDDVVLSRNDDGSIGGRACV